MTPFGGALRAALLEGRRSGVAGNGRATATRSDGYEFAELRGYVDGDDPRRIDWAATARAGTLQTRLVLEERSLLLAAAVDSSLSMHVGQRRSNFDVGCEAARAWYSAASDDDRCARLGARALVLRDVRGRSGAAICAAHRESEPVSFAQTLQLALAALPRGARLLVASDFFELAELVPLLRACAARFDLTALVASDSWRGELPLGGFVRLRDAETRRVTSVFVSHSARERYRRAVALREARVAEELRRAGSRSGVLDAETPVETSLASAFGFPWHARTAHPVHA